MTHASTDLNPIFLAGDSVEDEGGSDAVADEGTGKAEGSTISVKMILNELGAPS